MGCISQASGEVEKEWGTGIDEDHRLQLAAFEGYLLQQERDKSRKHMSGESQLR
jgi:hypothetical protein